MNTKYNGWTNYETWRINLEYFDDYEPDEEVTGSELESMMNDMLDSIEWGESSLEQLGYSLVYSMLQDVNWGEIADSINQAYELGDYANG